MKCKHTTNLDFCCICLKTEFFLKQTSLEKPGFLLYIVLEIWANSLTFDRRSACWFAWNRCGQWRRL